MNEKELELLLKRDSESEHIEFKEAKTQLSVLGGSGKNKRSLLGYAVALGNEGGGKIVLGVTDQKNIKTGSRDVVGSNAIGNPEEVKSQIYDHIGLRIDIHSIDTDKGRVFVIDVPPRPIGQVLEFHGMPLMRVGQELRKMDHFTLKNILNETVTDFSSEICEGLTLRDLDVGAIKRLKSKWAKKANNKDFGSYSDEKALQKLLLLRKGGLTYAALLLLGTSDSLTKILPNAEIIFEWRTKANKMDFDFRKDWRAPFLNIYDEMWETINARNSRVPFKQGFIEGDIWAYEEQVIREAILNAFAHREYRGRSEPVFIKLSPEKFKIKSPGGFLPGVNPDNVLYVEGHWRNRFLMEVLQNIGLVERAGVGLDRIFSSTISSGKGMPDFEGTDRDSVVLNIPTKVQDINFIYFFQKIAEDKQLTVDAVEDIIYLEHIRTSGKSDDDFKKEKFLKAGFIEATGRGRGTRYILSKDLYVLLGKKGEYTRKKWLSKEEQKAVLLKYFKQHKKGRMRDFRDELFERRLNDNQIKTLLYELKKDGHIYFEGPQRSPKAFWRLK